MTMVTPQQVRLIRDSFPSIAQLSGPIANLFYGRLFELAPEVRPMFKQDIAIQGRKLMEMLNTLVTNLEHFDDLQPTLKALGQRHSGYGVRPLHYQTVATALIWSFGVALEGDLSPEARTAWAAVIESVSTVMKEGASEIVEPQPE
jgi:hemoglobin-like flavoprotein